MITGENVKNKNIKKYKILSKHLYYYSSELQTLGGR